MILFLDFETTFIVDEKKQKDPSPYIADNYLVSAGWDCELTGPTYAFYQHNDLKRGQNLKELQKVLDQTTLLVAHNAKFELSWLHAVGLHYEGKIACTMIREYVLAKGQKIPVDLANSCIHNNVQHKKSELIDDYIKNNIGFNEIPMPIIIEYGLGDVASCKALYFNQLERLKKQEHLWPTVNLMEEFCRCLTEIEDNGIKIDVNELNNLEKEYQTELNQLSLDLQNIVKDVMGNTPINIDSPEQLSWVLYSRKVIDKKAWKDVFNLGVELRGSVLKPKRKPRISPQDFVKYIKLYTVPIYKTIAEQCFECKGKGFIQKVKANGSDFKRTNRCSLCGGSGVSYLETTKIAGFKFVPSSPTEASAGGFGTSTETIQKLKERAEDSAKIFLEKLERKNSISTYISTFIGGIRRGLRNNAILHTNFMQCITATGRLSSRHPNFQNQPRNATFPIRKTIVSRFSGGCILSGDAKQLEFRIAGELSNDNQIYEDVVNGLDVHSKTAEHTGFNRQDSKPHTFAPVYGATDKGKPDNIARYYRYFQDRYKGLFNAHKGWAETVLNNNGSFILPSGREYVYPNTVRYYSGGVSNSTIIANYPVQGFATADLMPIFCINTWKLYKQHGLKSLIILEVHDDVTVDVYPGELEIAARLMVEAFNSIPEECIKRYNYRLKMPLEVELKVGTSWFNQKEYKL